MLKLVTAFFTLVIFTNTNAFFWDSKIIEVSCIDDNNTIALLYKYEFKDKEVYETLIEPKQKILLSLTKLKDCVIKDAKNWVCGRKSTSEMSPITYKIERRIQVRSATRFKD